MAEGMLGGILGGEEEKPEVEPPEALASAEAFASAVAAKLAGNDPGVARKTEEFLSDQSQLLKVQKRHLEEEHAARLHFLRGQAREVDVRRFSLHLRVGFQLFMVLVATVIGIGGLAMIRDAITARGVVVEAFSVPPELAQHGLTGQVIAKQVLDQLSDMQARTTLRSARPANSYSSSWGNDLKVEVPSTGVSFGELRRYLRETLGHESHISGEVYATLAGITVTARTGDTAGRSFTGRAEELDKLVRQAAESVYEQTQPYRFARFLLDHERRDEGLSILERLQHDPDPVERAWARGLTIYEGMQHDNDYLKAAAQYRAALKDHPAFGRNVEGGMLAEFGLGHDALGVELADQCLAATPEVKATIAPAWQNYLAIDCQLNKSAAVGDYSELLRAASIASLDFNWNLEYGPFWIVLGYLRTHDSDAASTDDWEAALAAVADFPEVRRRLEDHRDFSAALVTLESGEPRSSELWTTVSVKQDAPAHPKGHDYMLRNSAPWLALAKARFGDLRGGQALIASTPTDCRICVQFRGRIAVLAGNAADAEKWFAKAIELAPKLPQVYVDRGQARLDRGEVAGALADATQAATVSPHNCDAWKLWGDVLEKQGNGKDALAKYDEALRYAPNWKQLKEAREVAAKQSH